MAVRAAEQKGEIAVAEIATMPEQIGKAGTGQRLAAFIKGDDKCFGWDRAAEAFRLLTEPLGHFFAPRLG